MVLYVRSEARLATLLSFFRRELVIRRVLTDLTARRALDRRGEL